MKKVSRRSILRNTAFSTGALLLSNSLARAGSCVLTPSQVEGPFYPVSDQPDKDNDLTSVRGRSKKALGKAVIMYGVVHDDKCQPVEGALVEIWQACATGKYNHPGDPNPAELDPNFQYWGRALTNSKGEYSFKTIRPGYYQASADWIRPSHIHLKAHRRGYEELTTQVYFKGDPYNSRDRILQSLSEEKRKSVIVDFQLPENAKESSEAIKQGRFDITIKSF